MQFGSQRKHYSKRCLKTQTPWAGLQPSPQLWRDRVPGAAGGAGAWAGLSGSCCLCWAGGHVVRSPGSSRLTTTACPCPQVTREASACCVSCRTTSSRPSPTVATPSSPCPSSETSEVRAASFLGWRGRREGSGGCTHRV